MGSISFHERLLAIGKPHLWQDYGNGCHTFPNFTRQIVDTLAVFQRLLREPLATPASFDFRSIEPRFDIYGWRVETDPARALESLRIEGGPSAVALTGSGRTRLTTPASYRGLKRVDVDGTPTAPRPDGRLSLTVDLSEPHAVQQYTQGAATTFTSRRVVMEPHAVLRIASARRVRSGVRVCARVLGGEIRHARITAGRRTVRISLGANSRCRTLAAKRSRRVTIRGSDRLGHPVRATARIR